MLSSGGTCIGKGVLDLIGVQTARIQRRKGYQSLPADEQLSNSIEPENEEDEPEEGIPTALHLLKTPKVRIALLNYWLLCLASAFSL
jgi:hypothetical protein